MKDRLRKIIRNQLPPIAFQRSPGRLAWFGLHSVIVAACFYFAGGLDLWWVSVLLGLCAAQSLVVIGFLSHELTHGAVLKQGRLRKFLESLFWAINLISRTTWEKLHNQKHHANFGTADDPDRQFAKQEENSWSRWYVILFFPNKEMFPGNPLVFLYLITYTIRNYLGAFWSPKYNLSIVPYHPVWTQSDRKQILFDVVFVIAWQVALFSLARFSVWTYLLTAGVAYSSTSAVVMIYIFTNHFLHPISVTPDPIAGSTSVAVPRWIDWFHFSFSYHTEHHLFPTMNSRYYHLVSPILAREFPDTYQRIPILEAWRRLWKNPAFFEDPVPIKSQFK